MRINQNIQLCSSTENPQKKKILSNVNRNLKNFFKNTFYLERGCVRPHLMIKTQMAFSSVLLHL